MKQFVLHIDWAAKNVAKCYTIHVPGCKHANLGRGNVRGGGCRQIPVTGMDDPTVVEAKQLDWVVTMAPCTKTKKEVV